MATEKVDALIRLKRAKIRLQKEKPFFSDLLFFLEIIKAEKGTMRCPTMGINMKGQLFFDEGYVNETDDERLKGGICHEVLHLALLHIQRGVGKPHSDIWNMAIDCQTNFILAKNGFTLPKCSCVPDLYGNKVKIMSVDDQKVHYEVEDVENKTAEEIYNELLKKFPNLKNKKCYVCIGSGDDDGKDGKGKPNFNGFDTHFTEGVSKEEAQRAEQDWKQRLINASVRAKSIGSAPAGMGRLVDELLEPKVNWREKLYRFITNDMPNDFSFRRPHKRSQALGWYVPNYLKENLEVCVFIDTSGSIGEDELKEFKSENIGIAKAFESIRMTMGYCDAEIQGKPIEVVEGNQQAIMESQPKGGGGTDMRKIFKWIDKNKRDAKVVIVFTDGYTPWPKADELNGRHVLWIITKDGIDIGGKKDRYHEMPDDNIGEFVKLN